MKILIDYTHPHITMEESGDLKLTGECTQCGQCCQHYRPDCPHFTMEVVDGVEQATCKVYYDRPIGCVLWPLPEDEFPGCPLAWVVK